MLSYGSGVGAAVIQAWVSFWWSVFGWGGGVDEPVPVQSRCASGTWDHDGNPATSCVDWSVCQALQIRGHAGSATTDRVCKDARSAWQFGAAEWNTSVSSVVVDRRGNLFVAGSVEGDADQTSGEVEAYVRKYDATGRELWTKRFGGDAGTWANAVAVNGEGHVFVVGGTRVHLDDGTPLTGGNTNAYVRHYHTDGEEVWTRQFGGDYTTQAQSVAVDRQGRVIVAGTTEGNLHDAAERPSGKVNAYVRQYHPDGEEAWLRQTGGYQYIQVQSLAVDSQGHVIVAEQAERRVGDATGTRSGEDSAYLRKYDANGVQVWMTQLGGGIGTWINSVAVDPRDDIFVAGVAIFGGLDDGSGTIRGDGLAFLRKYPADGGAAWTVLFGGDTNTAAYSVAVDDLGTAYVAGNTEGEPDEGAGDAGAQGVFLRKFGTNGTLFQSLHFGSSPGESVHALAVGRHGDVFVAGDTSGSLFGTRAGGRDGFVVSF